MKGLSRSRFQLVKLRAWAQLRLMQRRATGWIGAAPTMSGRTGLALVFGPYLAFWGVGLFSAGWVLAGSLTVRPVDSWPRAIGLTIQDFGTSALLLGLIVAVLRLAGAGRAIPVPRTRADWAKEAQAGRWFLAAMALGMLTMAEIGALMSFHPTYPRAADYHATDLFRDALSSLFNGSIEEPFFLAFTLVILRRAGFNWPSVIAVSVVLRWLFHLYYGVPSLGMVVWALGSVIVYLLTGRIIGLMVVHGLWDLMATGFSGGAPGLGLSCALILAGASLAPGTRSVIQSWRSSWASLNRWARGRGAAPGR